MSRAPGRPVITLLTDFGTQDWYVAEMKAMLLSGAPDAILVDVSHEISPGDVRSGGYVLARIWERFPRGTVHLAVVDPGVGTERRALAAAAGAHAFVAPDNGLLSFLSADARFVELPVPDSASATFHGRDVFAPAVLRLARGAPLEELGRPITDALRLPVPTARRERGDWVGTVVHVDRFGTLITNIPADAAAPGRCVSVAGRETGPVRRTFGDVAAGSFVAFIGSGGMLEIAVRDGSATAVLGVGVGWEVRVASA